ALVGSEHRNGRAGRSTATVSRVVKTFRYKGFARPPPAAGGAKACRLATVPRTFLEARCETVSADRHGANPKRFDPRKARLFDRSCRGATIAASRCSHRSAMTLRDLATTETTALVDRLLAAMTAELDAATCRLQADADAALAQLRSDLAKTVADVERAARGCEEAERARDAEAGRRASLQRDLDEATARIAAARADAIAETEKLQAEANARIEAVIAAAAKRQAEDQETIGALTEGARTLQADAQAQVDAIAADAARQQAEATARIEALMATAASVQAEAEAQIDAIAADAARQQTEAAARID